MIVYFTVEGGFANLARSIAIADGRRCRGTTGGRVPTRGRSQETDLQAIVTDLDRSGLFDRNREYPAPAAGADLQRYEIRYEGATVVAYDTTVPAELSGVVARLDQLTARV